MTDKITLKLTTKQANFLMRAMVSNYAEQEEDFDPNDIGDNGPASEIIGKLVSKCPGATKLYYDARAKRKLKEPTNKKLFCGSGWHYTVDINNLHKRLAFAGSELSGMEQNGGMGHAFNNEMDQKCRDNIYDVIKDILFAFDLITYDF